jgi:hypothetical protein
VALGLAGFLLVLVRGDLAPSSLYQDDAWQALATRVSGWGQVLGSGVTAPGYAVALRLWSDVAGRSPLALQLPDLIAALALPALTYLLARRADLHRLTAALAATLIATSTTTLTYATRVKPYTLDATVTIGLLLLSRHLLDHPCRARRWATLGAAGLVALVFSASTVPVTLTALAVPLAAAAHRAYRTRTPLAALPAAAVTTTYLTALFTYQHLLPAAHLPALRQFWMWEDDVLLRPGVGLHRMVGVFPYLVDSAVEHLMTPSVSSSVTGLPGWPVILLTLGFFAGLAACAWRRKWAWLAWLGFPPAIALCLALVGDVPFGDGRTDLYLYPCVVVAAAYPLDLLLRCGEIGGGTQPRSVRHHRVRRRPIGAVVGVVVAVAAIASLLATTAAQALPAYPVNGSPQVESEVLRALEPGDVVVLVPGVAYDWAYYDPATPRLVRDRFSMTGYTPAPDRPGEVVPSDFLEFTLDQGGFQQQAVDAAAHHMAGALAWQRARGGHVLWLVELPGSTLPTFLAADLAEDHFRVSGGVSDADLQAVRYVRAG